MKSKLILAGLIAALSLSLGTVAAADEDHGQSGNDGDRGGDTMRESAPTDAMDIREFQAMDINHDGYISKDEARSASFRNRFEQLDRNRDGKLSSEELSGPLAMRQ